MARATEELRAVAGPTLAGRLDELVTYIDQQRELTIESASKIGRQLGELIRGELGRLTGIIPDESGLNLAILPEDWMSTGAFEHSHNRIDVTRARIAIDRPVELSIDGLIGVGVAQDLSSRFVYRIAVAVSTPDRIGGTSIPQVPPLDLRFEDVYPSISNAGHARITLLIETLIGWLIDQAKVELRKVLRQAGYDSF